MDGFPLSVIIVISLSFVRISNRRSVLSAQQKISCLASVQQAISIYSGKYSKESVSFLHGCPSQKPFIDVTI